VSTIYIIEDNENIRWELRDFLQRNGYETVCPADPEELPSLLSKKPADLILLDIRLGSARDGFELCRDIRKSWDVPVIFITGLDREEDELRGLSSGGDDFIRKPYSLNVLLLRVKRLIERSKNPSEILTHGDLTLYIVRGQLQYKEQTLDLSGNELRILYYLWIHYPHLVSRDELIEYLWENKLYVDENILSVNLSRMRKRLEGIGLKDLIHTVHRQGYRLNMP
jgi:two-component system response regulator protein BraR/BceR